MMVKLKWWKAWGERVARQVRRRDMGRLRDLVIRKSTLKRYEEAVRKFLKTRGLEGHSGERRGVGQGAGVSGGGIMVGRSAKR